VTSAAAAPPSDSAAQSEAGRLHAASRAPRNKRVKGEPNIYINTCIYICSEAGRLHAASRAPRNKRVKGEPDI